ncbi:hypothetical protein [Longitalea luteola]|uniref:hypothetical protein n=1 Tax=Longitalea luteola TaxID=2812563 RepID=UPI001A962218|nr:hypothetical protein [Longitalea luteola]
MRKSRMKKIKTYGYKKKRVIVPRAKKKKKKWCTDKEFYADFVPRHVIQRHEGRRVRKAKRSADKSSSMRVVK